MGRREPVLTVLGWLMVAGFVLGLPNGTVLARLAMDASAEVTARLFALWSLATLTAWLVCGIGTLKVQPWAWTLALTILAFNCVGVLARLAFSASSAPMWAQMAGTAIGLVLYVVGFIVLFLPSVRSAYKGAATSAA